MTLASLAASRFPIRADLAQAHREGFAWIGAPGTWWSGAERVAIARAAREPAHCALCHARKQAMTPAAVSGSHVPAHPLPDAVVDLAHRVASDPARLTRRVLEQAREAGISEGQYVECVAVAARVVAIDAFCTALGLAVHPLPPAQPGEPSRHRPASAKGGEAWVPLIAPEDASGPDADLYGGARRAPNILRALSLVPDEVRALRRFVPSHYVPFERVVDPGFAPPGRALSRAQMELAAARVSALNQCFY